MFGNEALAQTDIVQSGDFSINSQTITLLEANTSSASILEDNSEDEIDQNANVNIVADNALLPSTGPLGVSNGTEVEDFSYDEVTIYVVRSGDTVSLVADMFGISVDTVLSANEMKKGEKLKEGDVLLILPFSGVEHTITSGQTLQGIANLYKVDIDEILLANEIDMDTKLSIGEKLMIPGAGILSPKTGSTIAKGGSSYASMPSIVGYFKNPVPTGRKSRGLTSKHRGVDIAAPTGTPIYASAAGIVLTAKMGWNGAYGNMVILQHSNGTKTLYGHMVRLGTTTGANVSQGDIIGYVGSSGRSTGPHLHFEVIGAKNPF
jgi:murein DD-endopeptidase MepM/ murein hydrolase activator NlpD